MTTIPRLTAAWHDTECASYTADLGLWRELAAEQTPAGMPEPACSILDLGCGTGRVALDLAAAGHAVTGLDADSELADELARRARERRLRVDTIATDARSFALERRFELVIAPMQVVQLLGGRTGRIAMLKRVREHLAAGAVFAAALADPFEAIAAEDAQPPLPDVLELDGWVLSSQPLAVRPHAGGVAIDRLRQLVSPSGELHEELVTIELDGLSAEQLETEGQAAGLRDVGRRFVPETLDYVGSTVVILEVAT